MHTIVNVRLSCVEIEADRDSVCEAYLDTFWVVCLHSLVCAHFSLYFLSACIMENMLVQRASYKVVKYYCTVMVLT